MDYNFFSISKAVDMSMPNYQIKRLMQPFFRQKRVSFEANIAYFIWWLLPILGILFTKYLIHLIELSDRVWFSHTLIIVSVVIIAYFASRFSTVNRWRVKWFWAYQKSIRDVYLKKILYIDNNHYDQIGTGNLIAIVERGVQSRAWLLVNIIRYAWWILITLCINIYYIYQLKPIYVVYFLIVVAIILYVWLYADEKMRKYRNQRREEQREGTRRIVKLFMSKFDVLQNDKIDVELKYIADTSDKAILANKKMGLPTEVFFLWPQVAVYIFLIAFFYYWWNLIFTGQMTLSFFYWIVSSLFLLQWVLDKTLTVLKDISKDWADIEKLWSLVDDTPTIKGIDEWNTYAFSEGKIDFSHVYFWYNKWHDILHDFNFTITPWKKLALVWPSGAGKTTIVKLIAWYIQATAWHVLVDWQYLPSVTSLSDTVSLKSYYKHIWYLTQEPSVFDWSVYENLIYALDYEPTEDALNYAIQQSQCQFVYDFPHWLQTQIWEKWIRLSGWQRQRLAIAKIFLKNPKIILLDEPTSALDSISEEAITKALDKLFEWRTVVVIAHRLQTVKKADDIIVLAGWKIAERGTHNELVTLWWQYAKMLELQSWF